MNARMGGVPLFLFLFTGFLFTGWLAAADVSTAVSTRETYVGLPFLLQIKIKNSAEHEQPEMPEVDGLIIESAGPPSRSSQISIVNGRRSEQSTVTYSYRVTPQREGSFTLPPVKVVADGIARLSKAVRIVASKSDTDDLMFVEIEGKAKQIYVGEALDLTLKIWIHPYRDKELQITLDEGDMWSLISKQTSWGKFGETLERMADNGKRPGGQGVLREDSSGKEREYLLYEFDATIYPDRPGTIDGDDVRIILDYPVELGRARSRFPMFDDDIFGGSGIFDDGFFPGIGSRLAVTKSRPIVAEAELDPIVVKPIPNKDRPDDYRGAVGRYTILTEAEPTRVKVGDPITLRIGIDGTGPMDLVRAPPLAAQKDLIQAFKVPDEPLAGFVEQSRKVFTTTIRPLNEGVTEIPPIAFSFFDPQLKKFVTTKSEPISIQVEPADVLALDAIVSGQRPRRDAQRNEELPAEPTAEIQLFAGPELLDDVPRPPLVPSSLITMLAIPPLATLAIFSIAYRHVLSSLVSARREFNRAIASAQSAAEVGDAVETFLARRFRLPRSRLTRDQTIGQLRALGYRDLAIRVERLYAHCERASANPQTGEPIEPLKAEANAMMDELTHAWPSVRLAVKKRQLSSASVVLVLVTMLAASMPVARADETIDLSPDQQRVLLEEAASLYAAATEMPEADAKSQFAKAGDKLQLLVDSGVRNDRLYFDLASARFRSGQIGYAIANYRRALRLDPTNPLYREHLSIAEKGVLRGPSKADFDLETARRANDWLLASVPPPIVRDTLLVAWALLWGIISLRILRFRFHWKSAASLTLLCVLVAGGSYLLRVVEFARDDTAVVVQPTISIREGDGNEFRELTEVSNAEGRVVTILDRRGDWMRIDVDGEASGWVIAKASEEI